MYTCTGSKRTTQPRWGKRPEHHQRGVALVVALVLLVVMTLVGLAAVSGTIIQGKMAANQYDRELAFQSAAAALRIARSNILDNHDFISRNCRTGGVVCLPDPFTDPHFDTGKIQTVPTTAFNAGGVASGQPQYVIESLGANWINPASDTGFNQSANAHQYGAQGESSTATYYRITARSGDPSQVGDRAIVTLQAIIKQS